MHVYRNRTTSVEVKQVILTQNVKDGWCAVTVMTSKLLACRVVIACI